MAAQSENPNGSNQGRNDAPSQPGGKTRLISTLFIGRWPAGAARRAASYGGVSPRTRLVKEGSGKEGWSTSVVGQGGRGGRLVGAKRCRAHDIIRPSES